MCLGKSPKKKLQNSSENTSATFIHLCICYSLLPSSRSLEHSHVWTFCDKPAERLTEEELGAFWSKLEILPTIFRLESWFCHIFSWLAETYRYRHTGAFVLLTKKQVFKYQWCLTSRWHVATCASTHGPEPDGTWITTKIHENSLSNFLSFCFKSLFLE